MQAKTVNADLLTGDLRARIELHSDDELEQMLAGFGAAKTTAYEAEIERVATAVNGGTGDPYKGKVLFTQRCGACHTLFAKGGAIGPDLTGFQRHDLDAMLLGIIQPSAEIREGFATVAVTANDGRLLTGFLQEETKDIVRVRGLDGAIRTLKRGDIKKIDPVGRSLMPEGLLNGLADQQLRDLFGYLRSTQPLNN
jgi:putative heme-binding domain-containing protein